MSRLPGDNRPFSSKKTTLLELKSNAFQLPPGEVFFYLIDRVSMS